MDYIARVPELLPEWSLQGSAEVSEEFAQEFVNEISDAWPAVIFQSLVDAYPALDLYPLSLEQAREMGWPPYSEDEHPPAI